MSEAGGAAAAGPADDLRLAVVYDADRLAARRREATPTGIDRVDVRHAAHLAARPDLRFFLGVRRDRRFVPLPPAAARTLLDRLVARWVEGRDAAPTAQDAALDALLDDEGALARAGAAERARLAAHRGYRLYVNSSHGGLDDDVYLGGLRERLVDGVMAYVHDLIPVDHPEYVRPGDAEKHAARLETLARLDAVLLANSDATAQRLRAFHAGRGRAAPEVAVLRIGVEPRFLAPPPPSAAGRARFLMLGTIEPRKNHVGMLHLWRSMARRSPPEAMPELVIVGRRGWENEGVFALLDRCAALRPHVRELSGLDDDGLLAEMAGARALLFPSFAEGWGMPAVEALAAGLPVIASDDPALREATQGIAEHLDPIDLPAWERAIRACAAPDSPERATQVARLKAFTPPRWEDHLAALDAAVDGAVARAVPPRAAPQASLALFVPPPEAPAPDAAALIAAMRPRGWRAALRRRLAGPPSPAQEAARTADALRDAGRWTEAAACYAAAAAAAPDRPGLWLQLGHMRKEAGEAEAAREAYAEAARLAPRDPEIQLQIGHLYNRARLPGAALQHYEAAMALCGEAAGAPRGEAAGALAEDAQTHARAMRAMLRP